MRLLKIIIGSVFLLAALTGCLKVNTTINLNPDGTGTIEETVMMKGTILSMIKEFTSSFDENVEAEEFKLYKEEEQRAKASDFGKGVEFVSGSEIIEPDFEGYKVVYSFKDINKLKLDPSPDNKVNLGDEQEESSETVREYLTFNFKKGTPSELNIIFPKTDFVDEETVEDESADSLETGMNEMFNMMFDGMRISMNLNLNGKISETNATFVEENKITMVDIDFAELMKNKDVMSNFEKNKPQSLEEFRELTKDIDGIKIEFNEEVKVKFQ